MKLRYKVRRRRRIITCCGIIAAVIVVSTLIITIKTALNLPDNHPIQMLHIPKKMFNQSIPTGL